MLEGEGAVKKLIEVFLSIIAIVFILSIFLAALSGCYTGYSHTQPKVKPETARQQAERKPITHKRCDETGCYIYDRNGNRRYDLESPYAN